MRNSAVATAGLERSLHQSGGRLTPVDKGALVSLALPQRTVPAHRRAESHEAHQFAVIHSSELQA